MGILLSPLCVGFYISAASLWLYWSHMAILPWLRFCFNSPKKVVCERIFPIKLLCSELEENTAVRAYEIFRISVRSSDVIKTSTASDPLLSAHIACDIYIHGFCVWSRHFGEKDRQNSRRKSSRGETLDLLTTWKINPVSWPPSRTVCRS